MKLSISNIAWNEKDDKKIYEKMKELGFKYLEIAPTRWVSENPYSTENIIKAEKIAQDIEKNLGIKICSMQSILYGVSEKIFGNDEEKEILKEKVKEAINYANKIRCKNLVFGSPKNRNIETKEQYDIGVEFFKDLSSYSKQNNVNLSIEPNPVIYGTNYINTTKEAIELVNKVNSQNFGVNYDLGTVIQNDENLELLKNNIKKINHIHISEPYLEIIQKRELHKKLFEVLKNYNYQNIVSIEMKKRENIEEIFNVLEYISGISN